VSEEFATVVAEPKRKAKRKKKSAGRKPPVAPRYHVILWDDSDHTYEYVQLMMMELFGMSVERGFEIAWRVDKSGRAICLTTSREHGELKVEQIHAYGADHLIPNSRGSMSATLERADD
jgi:ATP-dependent Clp protease adaptor protein ClpS